MHPNLWGKKKKKTRKKEQKSPNLLCHITYLNEVIQVESLTYIFPFMCQPVVEEAGGQLAGPCASRAQVRATQHITHLPQASHLTGDVPLLNPHSTGYRTLKLIKIGCVTVK